MAFASLSLAVCSCVSSTESKDHSLRVIIKIRCALKLDPFFSVYIYCEECRDTPAGNQGLHGLQLHPSILVCLLLQQVSVYQSRAKIRWKFMNSLCCIIGSAFRGDSFSSSLSLGPHPNFHPRTCDPQFVGCGYQL